MKESPEEVLSVATKEKDEDEGHRRDGWTVLKKTSEEPVQPSSGDRTSGRQRMTLNKCLFSIV